MDERLAKVLDEFEARGESPQLVRLVRLYAHRVAVLLPLAGVMSSKNTAALEVDYGAYREIDALIREMTGEQNER